MIRSFSRHLILPSAAPTIRGEVHLPDFTASLKHPEPPVGLNPILQALWHDAKGNWEMAHNIAQSKEGTAAYDRLHAYLHRKEGDASNARYWYRRAGSVVFEGSLQQEWDELVAQNFPAV
jgi:hypothetical protein